jgi:hypothetical protein
MDQTGRIPKHDRWLVHQVDGIPTQRRRPGIGMNFQELKTGGPYTATAKRRKPLSLGGG